MLCFYGDTVMSIVLWVVCRLAQGNLSDDAMKLVKDSVFATFGHGCAHFAIAMSPIDSKDMGRAGINFLLD